MSQHESAAMPVPGGGGGGGSGGGGSGGAHHYDGPGGISASPPAPSAAPPTRPLSGYEESGHLPTAMKLFGTWEGDRGSHLSDPRLCNLTLTNLEVLQPLSKADERDSTRESTSIPVGGPQVGSGNGGTATGNPTSSGVGAQPPPSSSANQHEAIYIAVSIEGTRRVLRSGAISLPEWSTVSIPLDYTFSLQYLHNLKGDSRKLVVSLQRRKRIKQRRIPGYKVLCQGSVDLALALQCSVGDDLPLYAPNQKSTGGPPIARLAVGSLRTQPIRSDPSSELFTDDEDGRYYYDHLSLSEGSSNEDEDDLEERGKPSLMQGVRDKLTNKRLTRKLQHLIGLRRFRSGKSGPTEDVGWEDMSAIDAYEDSLDALEDRVSRYRVSDESELSDEDDLVVASYGDSAGPSLQPFYTSPEKHPRPARGDRPSRTSPRRRLSSSSGGHEKKASLDSAFADVEDHPATASGDVLSEDSDPAHFEVTEVSAESGRTADHMRAQPPPDTHGAASRRAGDMVVGEQAQLQKIESLLRHVMPVAQPLPEHLVLVHANQDSPIGCKLAKALMSGGQGGGPGLLSPQVVIPTTSDAEIAAVLMAVIARLQELRSMSFTLHIGVMGNHSYAYAVLCQFVALFSKADSSLQSQIQFHVVPLVDDNLLANELAAVDAAYRQSFQGKEWQDTVVRAPDNAAALSTVRKRVHRYMTNSCSICQLEIGELMLTTSTGQRFWPFVMDLRIGSYADESALGGDKQATSSMALSPGSVFSGVDAGGEDLQVDYWQVGGKDEGKCSMKGQFKYLLLARSLAHMSQGQFSLCACVNKAKGLRIGKKAKDVIIQTNVNHVVCTSTDKGKRSFSAYVDGVLFQDIKFLSLSPQWRTQIKRFPVASFHNGGGPSSASSPEPPADDDASVGPAQKEAFL